MILESDRAARSDIDHRAPIVEALQRQLAELDRIGAHKAAAHLDAAIAQLRRDQGSDQSHD